MRGVSNSRTTPGRYVGFEALRFLHLGFRGCRRDPSKNSPLKPGGEISNRFQAALAVGCIYTVYGKQVKERP